MKPVLPLCVLCAVLALVVAAELRDLSADDRAEMSPRVVVPRRTASGPPPAEADASMTAILARPLFTLGRRPPNQSTAPPAPLAETQALPRLTAIIAGPSGRRAIFARAPGGRSLTVSVGDQIQEFHVVSIDDRDVVLSGPTGLRHLRPTPQDMVTPARASGPAGGPDADLPPGVLPEDMAPLPSPAGRNGRTP
jgi:type IV pilus biogenesis protein PilP